MDCAVVKSDILHREESTGVEVRTNRRRKGGGDEAKLERTKTCRRKRKKKKSRKAKKISNEDMTKSTNHTHKKTHKKSYITQNKKEISRGRRAPGVNLHYSKYSSTPMLFEP